MTDQETMKLALDALINGKKVRAGEGGTLYQPPLEDAAIDALRAAIAWPCSNKAAADAVLAEQQTVPPASSRWSMK